MSNKRYWVDKGVGLALPPSNKVVIPYSSSIKVRDILVDSEEYEVGYVNQLSYQDSRTVTRVRHVNFANPGNTIALIPAPHSPTINITGFALYKESTLLQRLSKATYKNPIIKAPDLFHSLKENLYPFDIIYEYFHPYNKEGVRVYLVGCLMNSFTEPISDTNTYVSNTVNVTVSDTYNEIVSADINYISNTNSDDVQGSEEIYEDSYNSEIMDPAELPIRF